MADHPHSPPQTVPSAAPPADGIQPSTNGQTASPSTPAEAKPAAFDALADRARHFGLYIGALAAIWVVAFLVLRFLFTLGNADALGFASLAAIVASFFVPSFLRQLHDKPRPATATAASTTPAQPADSVREIVETVVFVVVLVLLLKSFAAEAFVIPTGSMAETLYGYQKVVKCPQCGVEFPVNCSQEVDPPDDDGFGRGPREPVPVRACICPNCRQDITLARPGDNYPVGDPGVIPDPGWRSGDRVLVAKFVYDLLNKLPDRLDVVVFKYPGQENFPRSGPVKRHVPINYIKRLIGLPEETIAIYRGKLWVLSPEAGLRYDDPDVANDPGAKTLLWQLRYTHHNDQKALDLFKDHKFKIVRKNPENLLTMRRLVYDNDHQAKDLVKDEKFQRWVAGQSSGWSSADKKAFSNDGSSNEPAWLRYRHVLRRSNGDTPQLITDFMGYNTGNARELPGENWVSDLMVECEVKVEEAKGQFLLELSRGKDRFQAAFDLAHNKCTLYRIEGDKKPQELGSESTTLGKPGTYRVRFANIDDRLTVWVDDKLVFDPGVEYGPVWKLAPTKENDLERPASIGSVGAKLTVSHIQLYRDTYYTSNRGDAPRNADVPGFDPENPQNWVDIPNNMPVSTYYVQPGHFLCLGDNSPESSDGRTWGLVPQRLLLGRALLVYYPFARAGRIR